jgi:phosphoserine aminotransferase
VRVYNFSAGPAALPLPVLEQARSELTDWQGLGMSVMEVSHRSTAFVAAAEEAEERMRSVLAVPDGYHVLFLQGGATAQFAAVPLNLCAPGQPVDYVNTGSWSAKAIAEAGRYAEVRVVADEVDSGYTTTPTPQDLRPDPAAAFLHYTPNETIGGVEFGYVPDTGEVPLVADMSSTILSRPVDVSRYGVIYAGAQKNMGPAGLCLVVVREDLAGRARRETPSVLDYALMAKNGSMLNTPPTFGVYLLGLILRWVEELGGLPAMAERNRAKADSLYAAIDASDFYANPVQPRSRSWMNVPFTLADPALDETFLVRAREAGLVNLEGHRSVGGMRASLYNAMPLEGVSALVEFMKEFERTHS